MQQIGVQVTQLVREVDPSEDRSIRVVASAFANLVDDEFRAHCRVTVPRTGQLTINVDHPGLVYLIRNQWLSRLREALSIGSGRHLIHRIVFQFGTAGIKLRGPMENSVSTEA